MIYRKIMYYWLISPFIVIGALTSSMAWLDRKLEASELIERYVRWCEKVSKLDVDA